MSRRAHLEDFRRMAEAIENLREAMEAAAPVIQASMGMAITHAQQIQDRILEQLRKSDRANTPDWLAMELWET